MAPAPSFDELLNGDTLFQNKAVLSPHFVPETLLYRENEIRRLMECIVPVLQKQKPKNTFIYGKTGTGKTTCSKQVLAKLRERQEPTVKAVYMNCRVYDSRYKVLQKVITEFRPDFAKTGYSFSVLYEKLLDWLEGSSDDVKGKQLIVFLDEIDMVKDLDNLLYTLTRANDDLTTGSVTVIGISNKINFKQRLDSRSKSSLCEEEIVFQPYNAEQLQGILKARSETAFKPNTVTDSAVALAAAIAAGDNGDARYALILLLRAGELCEAKNLTSIADVHVEESRKAADEDKAFEIISTLPEQQQLVLYSVASLAQDVSYKRLVEEDGEKLYFSGEVYERYASSVKKLGKQPRTSRWYREYLSDLEMLGLINTVKSGKGIRGQTTLIRLAYDPVKVKKVIEKTVFSEA
ncbi:MAG: AAA family ATPase [Candidatus Micrarchaeota archaeon]